MDIDNKIESLVINESDQTMSNQTNFNWITYCNSEIYEIQAKHFLIPIRDIILGDISFAQKVNTFINRCGYRLFLRFGKYSQKMSKKSFMSL